MTASDPPASGPVEAPDGPADSTPAPTPPAERPIPRGCNPLVFGVVAATIQLVLTLYFMGWC